MHKAAAMNEQPTDIQFVAINYITCAESFADRFEHLFQTRARAIDRLPGFRGMKVLKPAKQDEPYLVVSHWTDEGAFKAWLDSPEFIEGHKRGFDDLKKAKSEGIETPMHSKFVTYSVLTD
jgi:heme-degrading monooxygenase HmoA